MLTLLATAIRKSIIRYSTSLGQRSRAFGAWSAPCKMVHSGKWRNGRRACLRSMCLNRREGSNPSFPTITFNYATSNHNLMV